jgi:hypothetical protein
MNIYKRLHVEFSAGITLACLYMVSHNYVLNISIVFYTYGQAEMGI